MKILSMTERRLQDKIDALNLVTMNEGVDIAAVRELLGLVMDRGYARGQDLYAKLDALLAEIRAED